jgi:uncharacterized protein YegL
VNKNLVESIIIVDRSGSMYNIMQEMNDSVNSLIAEQAKQNGVANITLVAFSDESVEVYSAKNAKLCEPVRFVASGGTRLYDTVCRVIDSVGSRLANTPEKDRPSLVSVIIVTDGMNTYTTGFSAKDLQERIEHQSSKYNWQFNFIGANQDSFKEAAKMGLKKEYVSNFTTNNTNEVLKAYSNKMSYTRSQLSAGIAPAVAANNLQYNDEDRRQLTR